MEIVVHHNCRHKRRIKNWEQSVTSKTFLLNDKKGKHHYSLSLLSLDRYSATQTLLSKV